MFAGVQPETYWSSTSYAVNLGTAWKLSLTDGYVYGFASSKFSSLHVWPARGGQ